MNNSFGIVRVDAGTNAETKRMPLGERARFGNGFVTLGGGTVWLHDANAQTISALESDDSFLGSRKIL